MSKGHSRTGVSRLLLHRREKGTFVFLPFGNFCRPLQTQMSHRPFTLRIKCEKPGTGVWKLPGQMHPEINTAFYQFHIQSEVGG